MKKRISQILAVFLALFLMTSICPSLAFAEGTTLTTSISSASVSPGSTFDVDVSLQNNPGISAYKIILEYDETVLTLNSVTYNTAMGGTPVSPQKLQSPVTLFWYSGLTDVDYNGTFATLSFTASDSLAQNTSTTISATFDEDDITNTESDSVPMTIENGTISVILVKPGDINGDNKTNNKDLVCFAQYMANWDVTVNEAALDTNGDGKVNNKDLVRLAQYLANWDVEIFPKASESTTCTHTLSHVDALAATCVSVGNIDYWSCSKCGKFFSDAEGNNELAQSATVIAIDSNNHVHKEIIPAKAATYTETGNKEGWRCLDCGTTEVEIIPILEAESYSIVYNEAGTNLYLAGQNLSAQNTNRTTYKAGDSFILKELGVPGFEFEGWYDGQGANANRISSITADMIGDIELYAHWSELTYTVHFISSLYPIDSITYTVSTGAVLPTPSLSNYVFVGWTNSEGNLLNNAVIPVGTVGNIWLTANWTSERYKTVTYTNLNEPTILYEDEDNNMLFFAYEIGEIQNVPLQTIHNFGYINGDGVTRTETSEFYQSVEQGEIASYSKAVEDATTDSINWTLSSGWTDSTSVDEQWCEEHGISQEEARIRGTSDTGTWNISSGSSGSFESTKIKTNQTNKNNEVKVSGSKSSTDTSKFAAGVEVEAGVEGFGMKAKTSASMDVEDSNSSTRTKGMEVGGSKGEVDLNTESSTSSSSWNTSSSHGGSHTTSVTDEQRVAIAEKISKITDYGRTYILDGNTSENHGMSTTQSQAESYSVSTSYSKITSEKVTRTYTTQGTKPGYHRWVLAGWMHIFAIVGYNMETKSFFTYTYSIMDDYTYDFEDYSYTTPAFDDNQNGVISFEVPDYVLRYVEQKTCYSEGLEIDMDTGIITGYDGTDNCVIIPDYMPVYSYTDSNGLDHYSIVKVTGISADAFSGNENIAAVSLPESITSIPDGAFENCTSLIGVVGGNVTIIGNNAFKGCTSIECVGIPFTVTSLGTNAFDGAKRILVNASKAVIAKNAVESGADNIVLYTNHLSNGTDEFSEMTLTIPAGTESVEFKGYGQEFTDLKIVSDAAKTVLNQFNITSTVGVPLRVSSSDIELNQVTINSNNLCLVSTASANLGLQGTVRFNSGTNNTVLARDLSLYKKVSNAAGTLATSGSILVWGNVSGQNRLDKTGDEIVYITRDKYNDYLNGVIVITLDLNGGEGLENNSSIEAFSNKPIGTLPKPTREFYEFDGWYTALTGGTKVTEASSFVSDTTLYAHWNARTYDINFNLNGGNGSCDTVIAFCDQAIGDLPIPTRNLYTFEGWYTAAEGGEKVSESTVRSTAEDLLLYAHWTPNQHTVTFNANAEDAVLSETSRVVSCDSAIGVLPNASRNFYRFDGWYTSADKNDGVKYTDTSIVTTDSDFTLYAHWVENDISDWTLVSEVPAEAQIIDEKWTYTLTSTTESTASGLSGWTQTGNYWSQTKTESKYYASFPAGYDTNNTYYKNWLKSPYKASETDTTKRTVTNETNVGFVYWHWMYDCGNSSGTPYRAIYNKKGTGSGTGYYYNKFGAFTSTKSNYEHDKYYCNSLGITNYIVPERTSYSQCQGATRWFRFSYNKSTYKEYQKIYQYQKVEDLESPTEVSASGSISNVQKWVRYRDRGDTDVLNNMNEEVTEMQQIQEPVVIAPLETEPLMETPEEVVEGLEYVD